MLRRLGGSSNSLWKPKNPHSLEYLKYLHGVLVKNEKVSENNRKILVEALRAIAEILIWGDQNDSSVFDYFLERQMLSHFVEIMRQDTGSFVCIQLLQTLNILFENIRHETSLYFLLSNNHVNFIITHKFDFNNEEIMAYYISFVKTLSFKLNPATIHFFFNEATNEFPLLTETLKLFDSSESMVRIAVRTIVLNIVRVNDESMQGFVKDNTRVYLCDVIDTLVGAAIDLDVFVRSAENVQANRDRLRDKVDDLVDLFHYIGELLETSSIAESLANMVQSRFLFPLLLNSLAPRRDNHALLLTPVSSLFFFSQFLFVVTYRPLIQTFLSAFLFEDISILTSQWIRSSDSYCLQSVEPTDREPNQRIFFDALLGALCGTKQDDYLSFYALMLVYAMFQNKGDVADVLAAASLPCKDGPNGAIKCEPRLMDALLNSVEASAQADSHVRPVTVELACLVLRQLVLASDDTEIHERIGALAGLVQTVVTTRLANAVTQETLFLEMFEDEYTEFEVNHMKMDILGYELLLPPAASPLSGLPLYKRLPSGHEERIRTTIQFYFHARKLRLDMMGDPETQLPLKVDHHAIVRVGDCINLNNSDLLSVTVVISKSEKLSRFLVTDRLQLILVEPEPKKAGWAIVKFVGLLQDTQITGDPSDSRSLHIVVEGVAGRGRKRGPVLTAKFQFEDHIRCMAAKQRLTKGRQSARQLKISVICELLGVRTSVTVPRSNPFKVVKGCAPGSVRKQMSPLPPSHQKTSSHSSLNSIPDDPAPQSSSKGGIHHV